MSALSAPRVLVALLLTLGVACARGQAPTRRGPVGPTPHTFVFVGTAGGGGQIAIFELDEGLGDLTPRGRHSLASAPVALAARPHGETLVAVVGKGPLALSLGIDGQTGALRPRGQVGTGGQQPGSATLDGTGKYALITHESSGTVSVVAIKPDGSLDAPETFPAGKGADGVVLHPSNQVAFVANRRAGTLSQLAFNLGTGRLTPKADADGAVARGTRPRQVSCHPGGKMIYVLDEATHSISAHAFDDRMGTLSRMALQVISTRHEPMPGDKSSAGEMRVAVNGAHIYVTDPGQDRLAIFDVDPLSGNLTLVDRLPTGGEGPEGLALDPQGKFLVVANRKSQSLAVLRLDARTGRATLLGQTRLTATPTSLVVVRPQPS